MSFLGKKVIYHAQDAHGDIHVVDDVNGVRSLYFGDIDQQSRMLLEAPEALVTAYEQVMACWQFFGIVDGDVLILGLGGATAAKYCLKALPSAQVHVVELRESVVDIAHQYFSLPNDPRLTVYIDNGISFIANQAVFEGNKYNLILVDMYDLDQLYTYVYTENYLQLCLDKLNKAGVLVINIWGTDQAKFTQVVAALGKVFSWKILIVPVGSTGNVIVFAFHPDTRKYELKDIIVQVEKLEEMSKDHMPIIPWRRYLDEMLANNRQQLHRLINL